MVHTTLRPLLPYEVYPYDLIQQNIDLFGEHWPLYVGISTLGLFSWLWPIKRTSARGTGNRLGLDGEGVYLHHNSRGRPAAAVRHQHHPTHQLEQSRVYHHTLMKYAMATTCFLFCLLGLCFIFSLFSDLQFAHLSYSIKIIVLIRLVKLTLLKVFKTN